MQKMILKKDKVEINLEENDKKIVIQFHLESDNEKNLDEFLYLLDKLDEYVKSGEYEVKLEHGE